MFEQYSFKMNKMALQKQEIQENVKKSDIITAEDLKAKVKLNEERCQMKVEDCMS